MNIVQKAYYTLGPYVSTQERSVGRFFAGLSEHASLPGVRAQLLALMQKDIATINVWTEFRYKGYTYLRKQERRRLYANLERIARDFDEYRETHPVDGTALTTWLKTVAPHARVHVNQASLIQQMMDYFSHDGGRFEYRDSSSFGRLLRDPAKERLVGDCNQIVTLYLYLYSRYFPISDLSIRTVPGHVALHYGGVDIETTTGEWTNYTTATGAKVMPVEEIVSINLLDTTDENFATHEIDPNDFLQATRFAVVLSHERDIVTHNLSAAYAKLINERMKRHDYANALKFAKQSRDMELLAVVGTNGAIHHMSEHKFSAARKYAEVSPRRAELIKDSYRFEGAYHYEAKRYHDAITAFKKYGDESLVQKCYEGLFFVEQEKLPRDLSTDAVKSHSRTIQRMRTYAKKSRNRDLITHADQLAKYL